MRTRRRYLRHARKLLWAQTYDATSSPTAEQLPPLEMLMALTFDGDWSVSGIARTMIRELYPKQAKGEYPQSSLVPPRAYAYPEFRHGSP